MKTPFLFFAAVVFFFFSTAAHSAETARARLFCESAQFQQATAYDDYGFRWSINLTTLSSGNNGELAPYFLNAPYDHSAYVNVYDEDLDETDSGGMGLNTPGDDANGNGFPDFFEVSQGVTNLTSSGEIQILSLDYDATFTATWNRAAGSTTGTCTYQLPNPFGGNAMQFTHAFSILEYIGPLTYTPGSSTVSANINLTQTGNSANTLQGPIIFDKSSTDSFNVLTNEPGVWTNAALQALSFYSKIFSREPPGTTNYAGYVFFADGDPNTSDPDYQVWALSIDDTNDADADGIPDFSDDPASVTPPRAPTLSLALGQTNLLLTIAGDVGRTNWIQEMDSLASTDWQTTMTLVLTNSPQIVLLPLPTGPTRFWRVLAQ